MTNSETNTASSSSGFVSGALSRLHLLGFAHAGTLAAMRCVSPVCPPVTRSVRLCASLSLSSARRLPAPSARVPAGFPDGFPPAPTPRLVSRSQTGQRGPLHAAASRAAATFTRRFALTHQCKSSSERTPNHALQRTPGFGGQFPRAAVVRPAQSRAVLPAMKPRHSPRLRLAPLRAHARLPGCGR